jgi:hypothetical protein
MKKSEIRVLANIMGEIELPKSVIRENYNCKYVGDIIDAKTLKKMAKVLLKQGEAIIEQEKQCS